jgi:hypothetical protein
MRDALSLLDQVMSLHRFDAVELDLQLLFPQS